MDEEMAKRLKYLRLYGLLAHWDESLALAQRQKFSPVHLLQYVVEQECKTKNENARRLRLARAHIPEMLVMETYPFDRQPKLDMKRVLSLYDAFEYIAKKQNIIWVGPTGVGKSGLATSFLVDAIHRGSTGYFVKFPNLIDKLFKSTADHSEQQVLNQYASYDCMVVDEVGYAEVEPAQVGQFFTLMQMRHKKKTTLITSNLGFSEWRGFLKNDHLTAALIDRLTENSHVINMKNCKSIRPTLSPPETPAHDLPEAS